MALFLVGSGGSISGAHPCPGRETLIRRANGLSLAANRHPASWFGREVPRARRERARQRRSRAARRETPEAQVTWDRASFGANLVTRLAGAGSDPERLETRILGRSGVRRRIEP